MSGVKRRWLLGGALGCLGAGVLGYGGSVAACSLHERRTALIWPLLDVLGDVHAPERIGRAWRDVETDAEIEAALLARGDLAGAALIAEPLRRRTRLGELIRTDFAKGDTVVADRWVVTRLEARLSAAWIST